MWTLPDDKGSVQRSWRRGSGRAEGAGEQGLADASVPTRCRREKVIAVAAVLARLRRAQRVPDHPGRESLPAARGPDRLHQSRADNSAERDSVVEKGP